MSRVRDGFSQIPTATGSMLLAMSVVCLPACGGTGDRLKPEKLAAVDAGLSVDPCNPSTTIETELIGCSPEIKQVLPSIVCPDFEKHGTVQNGHTDPDPLLLTQPTDSYSTYDTCKNAPDGTVCIVPTNNQMTERAIPSGEEHCGPASVNGYHMVARGQWRWGPQAYIQYDSSPYQAGGIDVSMWDGLAFWIKKGPEPTGEAVFVSMVDPVTNGSPDALGIQCDTGATAPDREKCDQFGFSVSFTEEWEYKVLPFSSLKQRGYGVHEPAVDLKHIIMLKFGFEVGDWDVWLDDISLWREK